MWPAFARELESASGEQIHLRQEGALMVATDRDEEEKLKRDFMWLQKIGLDPEFLSGYETRKLEPSLGRSIVAGVLNKKDWHVDNRAVTIALEKAFRAAGGRILENKKVDSVIIEDGVAKGVVCGTETIVSDFVVLAGGAFSRDIAGIPDHLKPPVRPLKGQMLALKMDQPLIQRMVWGTERMYIVPQPGRLLIGATMEEMGFDLSVTAGGLMDLLEEAFVILPAIYDLPISESWAGLRPASRDDAPILGESGVPGLIYATGHHRNGFLLAPMTAKVILELIEKGAMSGPAKSFTIDRFAA
jgi:glycine oxidase